MFLQIAEVGSLPAGVCDLYEATGSRKECAYTWDTMRNSNCKIPGKFRPRFRFDR